MHAVPAPLRALAARVRTLPPSMVDVVIAAACYVATVATPAKDGEHASVFAIAALATVPLVWRRRFPVAVTLLTGIGTIWLALENQIHEVPFGQLVATYTFASLSPLGWRLFGILGTAVGVVVSTSGQGESPSKTAVSGLPFVAAYAMGVGTRARRDRIAMLEERGRRLVEEHGAVAAREREQIARDMHDILAHSISLIVVQAEAGPVVVRSDPARAEAAFDAIADTGRDALTQLRRTLGILRSEGAARGPQPDLDGLGALVAQTRAAGLPTTMDEYGRRRAIPAETGVAAYRIVQESLTNALRHAAATTVRVRLEWRDSALDLEVSDDGRGPPERVNGGGQPPPAGAAERSLRSSGGTHVGHGLIGMRERVVACGGTLHTGAGADGGFRVHATLPLGTP